MENEIQKTEQVSPFMPIIAAASTNGEVDPDKLLKLLEASRQWEADNARKAFFKAMAAFKKAPPKIMKDKKGHNSNYAGLGNVTQVISKALSEHDLTASWETAQKEAGPVTVTCVLSHEHGHSERTSLTAASDTSGSKNAIQALGSTITYLERYTLLAITGLSTHEQDDDGAGAGGDPNAIPQPTETQGKVLTEICNKMIDSVPDGLQLDCSRIEAVLYASKGRYPNDMSTAGTIAAYLVESLNTNNTWLTVAREV